MSYFWRVAAGICVISFLSLFLFYFLPLPTLARWGIVSLIIIAGSYFVSRYYSQSIEKFLRQLIHVTRRAVEGDYGNRMDIFWDDRLGEAARMLNETVESVHRKIQSLREELDKCVSIMDEFSDGILAVNEHGRIIYLNDQARNLLKIDENDVQDHIVSEATRVEDAQEAIQECLSSEEPVQREGRRVDPDDELILTIKVSPLSTSSGEFVGAVASIRNITELRRLQTVRQDFVANVSHELKTPITAIQGLIETLASDQTMDEETRLRFTRKVRDQTRRMSNLVEDLLTISRLESDENEVDGRRFDVVEPVREAMKTLKPQADKKNHDMIMDIPGHSIYARGDPAAIRQITSNLLENAIKYTSENGRIQLRTSENGEDVVIQVEDNGTGIEPHQQERIFERFYRVDEARSREAGGTGLGLSIVKHLVLKLDGEVNVKSTPGQGSVFTIRIPLASEPDEQKE